MQCPHLDAGERTEPERRPVTERGVEERDGWQTLVDYHLAAVRLAAAPEPPKVGSDGFRLLDITAEALATGRGDVLQLTDDVRRFIEQTGQSNVVLYGWPVVVLGAQHGPRRVAPLLVTELELAPDGTAVPRDDEPFVNPALLSPVLASLEQIGEAQATVAPGIGFGDAQAVVTTARRIAEALGHDLLEDLDPDRLSRPARPDVGVHNGACLVRGPSPVATRSLISELQQLKHRRDWSSTAAAVLTRSVAEASPADRGAPPYALPPSAFHDLTLNDSQEQAVGAALHRDLTVVTGPPGTGKSQVVASIVANQWLSGHTVLVASTNNGAVDVAVERCAMLDEALLLRTGSGEIRRQLPAQLESLVSRPASGGPSAQVIRRQLEAAAADRQAVYERLEARTRAEGELAQALVDVEHLRSLLWGPDARSTPRADCQAVGRLVQRAQRRGWFRRRREARAVAAAGGVRAGVTFADVAAWATTEQLVMARQDELRAAGPTDADQDRADIADVEDAWASAGSAALRDTVQLALRDGRAALQHLARLRDVGQRERHQALERALPTVRAWACTSLSAAGNFPLKAGLFDLLVIDEASQCSIAHILPLAYRARRVVVVGDPNQLTPVVTLDEHSARRLALATGWADDEPRQQSLSAGHDSAFTAYAARHHGPPLLLSEHYRCHPAVARFLNDQFYEGQLRVLTEVDRFADGPRGLVLVDTPGVTQRGPHGSAVNLAEADAVVRWILEHGSDLSSVGVVTPFAPQRQVIEERLRTALGRAAAERVLVGTAHRFQGGERDVIVFSPTVARDAPERTLRWVEEQRNLVNVAVSRAKRALVIVTDTVAVAASPLPTLQALIALAGQAPESPRLELHENRNLHSDAERRLYTALRAAGGEPHLKEVVDGYELDLSLHTPTGLVDVEVDGSHHHDVRGRQRRQDLARDAVLQRLGWRVVRVPAWRALAEPDVVAEEILRLDSRSA